MSTILEAREERRVPMYVRGASVLFFTKFKVLFSAGIKLGIVLFVAISTVSVLCGSLNFAWAHVKQNWDQQVDTPRNQETPKIQSSTPVRTFRPRARVDRSKADHRIAREKRLLLRDIWGRANQTLSTTARHLPR